MVTNSPDVLQREIRKARRLLIGTSVAAAAAVGTLLALSGEPPVAQAGGNWGDHCWDAPHWNFFGQEFWNLSGLKRTDFLTNTFTITNPEALRILGGQTISDTLNYKSVIDLHGGNPITDTVTSFAREAVDEVMTGNVLRAKGVTDTVPLSDTLRTANNYFTSSHYDEGGWKEQEYRWWEKHDKNCNSTAVTVSRVSKIYDVAGPVQEGKDLYRLVIQTGTEVNTTAMTVGQADGQGNVYSLDVQGGGNIAGSKHELIIDGPKGARLVLTEIDSLGVAHQYPLSFGSSDPSPD